MREFKQLEIESVELPDGTNTVFRIKKQTHVGIEFGDGENFFNASNDVSLHSEAEPEIDDKYTIYVRGSNKDKDNKWIIIDVASLNKIKEAIKEYNEYFSGRDKVEEYRFFCNVADKSVVSLNTKIRDFTIKLYEDSPEWIELEPKKVWNPEQIQNIDKEI